MLPFENFSDSSDDDYFSRGFTEDLITDLSHFHNLQVISSYTSAKLGTGNRDELDVARELGIGYLLKGNLRRHGNQIRINTQLLDADSGGITWAERYDAPQDTVFDIQDDIVERVVAALSTHIDLALLKAARNKPLTSLAAYDCWLSGMEHLRQGTLQADNQARQMFKQALEIDPHYSRAYAGLSMSYFNEWSCQVWELYESSERNAYKYALQAVELDDTDHMVQLILGRILMYRRKFDQAEQHLDKSLALNANDADSLAQLSTCKGFLGKANEGETLFRKALRLNPYRNMWYYTYGAFTYFVQRQYDACIETALKGPVTDVWVDLPAYLAGAYAYSGDREQAGRYLDIFIKSFQKEITPDHAPQPKEIIDWISAANPFKYEADRDHLIDGLVMAGLAYSRAETAGRPVQPAALPPAASANVFKKENNLWKLSFGGSSVQLPEVKGFYDLVQLLERPGKETHSAELMGRETGKAEPDTVLDDRARRSYEKRIRDLQEELREAEEMNNLGLSEKLNAELDQLTEHLAKALGIGKRSRKLNDPSERARAAVTWRIRSAIRKIDAAHPVLGKHLSKSVRTGTFCSYEPETMQRWETS